MLDISVLTGDGATNVLSGKQRGLQAREDFKLDEFDAVDDGVSVVLSAGVEAITPSFVLGMFGASVRRCGSVDSFFEKYRFNTNKSYIVAQLRRGAEYSLVKGSALPF
jgi:hypothetical protein